MENNELKVARIFADHSVYYVCNEESDMLDTRSTPYPTKSMALRVAAKQGYTHAIGSGTPWENDKQPVQRIPKKYREE